MTRVGADKVQGDVKRLGFHQASARVTRSCLAPGSRHVRWHGLAPTYMYLNVG